MEKNYSTIEQYPLHERISVALDGTDLHIENFDRHVHELLQQGWNLISVVQDYTSGGNWLYYIFTRKPISWSGPR